jgi:type II restriction enzyme
VAFGSWTCSGWSGRPAFSHVADLRVRFLPYGDLERHREAMVRFGAGLKTIDAVARTVT